MIGFLNGPVTIRPPVSRQLNSSTGNADDAKARVQIYCSTRQGMKVLDRSNFEEYIQRYLANVKLSNAQELFPYWNFGVTGQSARLQMVAHIVIGTGHPGSTLLLDFYHLYRGGNHWDTLDYINCSKLPVFHINDYPGTPSREEVKDSDRIFPGDGICPFNELIPKLYKAGFRGGFSVELFNQGYWDTMDVKTILRVSYEKTLNVLKEAMKDIG